MILFKDCLGWIKKSDLSIFDLIFLDPPFNKDLEGRTLQILSNNKSLRPSCKIYLEHNKFSTIEIPSSLKILKEKILGDVRAILLRNED